jgi:hypothetical protein
MTKESTWMQSRVRHPRETMRDEGELRARAASVKANPTPDSRSSYNNNSLTTTSLLPATPLIDIDRYTLLNNADSQLQRLDSRHPPATVPQQTRAVS